MNTYIIPANSKRSQLIFSMFRGVDLIIFLIGASISLLLLILVTESTMTAMIIKLFPVGVASFLVMPFPNYHNVLTLLTEIYDYYSNRRVYLWRGWCLADGEEKSNK